MKNLFSSRYFRANTAWIMPILWFSWGLRPESFGGELAQYSLSGVNCLKLRWWENIYKNYMEETLSEFRKPELIPSWRKELGDSKGDTKFESFSKHRGSDINTDLAQRISQSSLMLVKYHISFLTSPSFSLIFFLNPKNPAAAPLMEWSRKWERQENEVSHTPCATEAFPKLTWVRIGVFIIYTMTF